MVAMDLDDMSGVLEAVAASSHGAGPQFLAALAAQAQTRLEQAPAGDDRDHPTLVECARLACGMVAAGAAPSRSWLAALQATTIGFLKPSAAQSSPPPSGALADLAWAVAQLASNTAQTTFPQPTVTSTSATDGPLLVTANSRPLSEEGRLGSEASKLLDPDWVSALVWCIDYRVTSPRGDPFQLSDLARVLWATAALGTRPRREVINSFVGKSQVGAICVCTTSASLYTFTSLSPSPRRPSRTDFPLWIHIWCCILSGRSRDSTPP